MHNLPQAAGRERVRAVSRRDALRYATALATLGAASVGCAIPTAAAARPQLIDFAARQIPAQQIRAAGYSGVINYVSLARPGSSFGAKPITRPYAESLTAAGLMIVSNYQYGKPGGTAPSDFTRGHAGGIADARTAWQLHTAAGGGQSAPIFFTIDEDINRDTWNRLALQWFRGINSVLGVQRTGVYGGINVCQWAAADGVIGSSSTAGRRWAWQTRAWSGNQVHPAAVLYQRVVSTASNPGPLVGGLEVDVNDVLAPDCGQWNLHSGIQPNREMQ
jgi:Rv2525c-like, glycoside hydrolase-like domain